MTDEDKLKSPTRKLKKNKGISSKYFQTDNWQLLDEADYDLKI